MHPDASYSWKCSNLEEEQHSVLIKWLEQYFLWMLLKTSMNIFSTVCLEVPGFLRSAYMSNTARNRIDRSIKIVLENVSV